MGPGFKPLTPLESMGHKQGTRKRKHERPSFPFHCYTNPYLRYALSYRDVEELMRERGVSVDHPTVLRWVQRYAPNSTSAVAPC